MDLGARVFLSVRDSRRKAASDARYPAHTQPWAFEETLDYRFINLYTMNPKRATQPEYDVDQYGFRQDSLKITVDSSPKLIWIFGGSTMLGMGVRANETIPAHLNQALATSGSEWRVVNMGFGAYTSTQELLLLLEMIHRGHRPGAIITFDGINELPFEGSPDEAGFPGWEFASAKADVVHALQTEGHGWPFFRSGLFKLMRIDDLIFGVLKRAKEESGKSKVSGQGGRYFPGDNWHVIVHRYLTNLHAIRGIANSMGIPHWAFFQPVMQYEEQYKWRVFSKEETEQVVPDMSRNEYRRREALLSPEMAGLRDKLAPNFEDMSDVFKGLDGQTIYVDPRHPNGAANKLIAERILKRVSSALK